MRAASAVSRLIASISQPIACPPRCSPDAAQMQQHACDPPAPYLSAAPNSNGSWKAPVATASSGPPAGALGPRCSMNSFPRAGRRQTARVWGVVTEGKWRRLSWVHGEEVVWSMGCTPDQVTQCEDQITRTHLTAHLRERAAP